MNQATTFINSIKKVHLAGKLSVDSIRQSREFRSFYPIDQEFILEELLRLRSTKSRRPTQRRSTPVVRYYA